LEYGKFFDVNSCPSDEELELFGLIEADNLGRISQLGAEGMIENGRREAIRLHAYGNRGSPPCDKCIRKIIKAKELPIVLLRKGQSD